MKNEERMILDYCASILDAWRNFNFPKNSANEAAQEVSLVRFFMKNLTKTQKRRLQITAEEFVLFEDIVLVLKYFEDNGQRYSHERLLEMLAGEEEIPRMAPLPPTEEELFGLPDDAFNRTQLLPQLQ